MVSIRLSVLGALAVLIAACAPVTNPAPIPTTTTTTRAAVSCQTDAPANAYAAYVDTPSGESEVVTFTASTPAAVDAKVAQLEVAGDVVAVGPDRVVSALAVVNPTNDPDYIKQWGNVVPTPDGYEPTKTQFTTAWETQNGTGITVAVIDTGVQADHPDLVGRLPLPGRDFVISNTTAGAPGTATDPQGHGTHVAGIIAAADNTDGVVGGAPASTLLAVRVLDSCGTGFISAVARGVDWAVDNEADVINMSLGTTSDVPVLEVAVNRAVEAGVVVVAAAGNSGGLVPSYPGAYPQAISVGAIDPTPLNLIASYSNRDASVDIAAPGSAIWSTWKTGYVSLSGTSMATPVVVASVALLLQKCLALDPAVVLTPAAVRTRLRATMSTPVSGFAAAPNEVGVVQPGTLVAAAC